MQYLQTQQLYEEQRRELESMEGENKHVKDTVEINIHRAKVIIFWILFYYTLEMSITTTINTYEDNK